VTDWLKIAMRRDVVVRGLKAGAIVGTILTAVNQGDLILTGSLNAGNAWKFSLTYMVPCCVSTHVGVSSIIVHRDENYKS
jgi:hypothetical protein